MKENLITKEDQKESEIVTQLIKKIDNIDENYVNTESELIFQKQPFLISLLLGFRVDLNENELEEVMKTILVIWEYYKRFNQIHKVKITKKRFNKIQKRNMNMLKYFEGENEQNMQKVFVESDLKNLQSKALLTGILFMFGHKEILIEMADTEKSIIIMGMKSLIECFDELIKNK